jgi:hypothetical protein
VLSLCLLGSACSDAYIALGPGGLRFGASVEYREWWAALESCSGKRFDINQVEFVHYDAVEIPGTRGWIGRATYKPVRRIELVTAAINTRGNVTHEMLHHLIFPESGHPAKYATMCPQVAGWP